MAMNGKQKVLGVIVAGTLGLLSSQAMASIPGAVYITEFDGNDNDIAPGETITASGVSGVNDSFKDPLLNESASGYTGHWFTFENLAVDDVTVNVSNLSFFGSFSPGFTVWASGGAQFNGGSNYIGTEVSTSGHSTPTSFNAIGQIGQPGTLWMGGLGGNHLETLGYALSGPSATASPTGWGESIQYGAHDLSVSDIYESGVTGSVSALGLSYDGGFGPVFGDHYAELTFTNLQPGWYTVFVGGGDVTQTGSLYDLTISAVPEMETWAMMLAGMGFLAWRARKQQLNAESMSA